MWRGLVAGVLAVGLGGCSATDLLANLTANPSIAVERGLPYASGPRRTLDVYQPPGAVAGGRPVVVFLYGGGWDAGDKKDYRFVGQTLAAQGFVAILPDYRLYPEVRYPAFLQDSAVAVRWARDHAAEHGGDPAKLFLMGHSAGAYNAVMLGVDRRWLSAVDMDPARDLRGVIGLAGPYDFLPLHSDELKTIFGPPEARPDTQPINHVDGRAPPLLLITDAGDKVVDPGNTQRMAARVRERGGRVEAVTFPGLSHALILGAIAHPIRFLAPVVRLVRDFVTRETGGRS
ncbi:MAG TPA: alpha/beta hydrolase [Caulobacteraceae bacterium]